jgi:hypothetical protein
MNYTNVIQLFNQYTVSPETVILPYFFGVLTIIEVICNMSVSIPFIFCAAVPHRVQQRIYS